MSDETDAVDHRREPVQITIGAASDGVITSTSAIVALPGSVVDVGAAAQAANSALRQANQVAANTTPTASTTLTLTPTTAGTFPVVGAASWQPAASCGVSAAAGSGTGAAQLGELVVTP